MRGVRGLLMGLCALALAGCATVPPSPEALAANDPYEQTNRDMLKFNGKIDKKALRAPYWQGRDRQVS